MPRPRRRRAALGLAGGTLLLATAALLAARSLSGLSVPPRTCAWTAPLTPQSAAGPPWLRHRHELVPGGAVPDTLSFLIRNRRSGEMFDWGARRVADRVDRFLVPTRYAELLNRDWADDPWEYCLVLDPAPPFRVDKNGFVTSTTVRPTGARPGEVVRATVTVTPRRTADVSALALVLAPDGTEVARHAVPGQSLRAGARVEYRVPITLPADAQAGVYVVKVGLFSADWTSLLHWNDGTAAFLVATRGVASAATPRRRSDDRDTTCRPTRAAIWMPDR
jgi:hypothetical protein